MLHDTHLYFNGRSPGSSVHCEATKVKVVAVTKPSNGVTVTNPDLGGEFTLSEISDMPNPFASVEVKRNL